MKVLFSDNGTGFSNKAMKKYCLDIKIKHQFNAPYNPQQNGHVEHELHSLQESARSMIYGRGLHKKLWTDDMNTACYLLNRLAANGLSAYE